MLGTCYSSLHFHVNDTLIVFSLVNYCVVNSNRCSIAG